jgi:23S rRNA (cytosine1962-C5)-methyltransferase
LLRRHNRIFYGQVPKASRGYKDIHLLAFKLLKPGWILVRFSCSGYISLDLFQKIIADAAVDAGPEVQIVRYLSQAADHPIALNFPGAELERNHLSGFVKILFFITINPVLIRNLNSIVAILV